MAKESSFDVVSTVDMQEVDNAFQQAKKELAQRYDLKDSGAEITLDKANKSITVAAPADFVAKQVTDVIATKLVKRGIDLGAVKWGDPQAAAGQSVRQTANVVEGIDKDTAGKINKDIKATKLKVKARIERLARHVSGGHRLLEGQGLRSAASVRQLPLGFAVEEKAALQAESRKSVAFVTLGCAKNEVDTEHMREHVVCAGYALADDPEEADAIVVNTCSFIQAATEESLEAVFEAADLPNVADGRAALVVAGCMPARYGADLEDELVEAGAFVPCSREDDIALVLAEAIGEAGNGHAPLSGGPSADGEDAAAEDSPAACAPVSAYVKISDGCDRFCSYCTIPFIRGRYRSFPLDEVRAEVRKQVDRGVREIVLIAQDTGRWGADFSEPSTLAALVSTLAEEHPDTWFRLMYIQPEGLTDELLEAVASHDNVCDYFDIPLQHVDADILRAMNRTGSRAEFEALARRVRRRMPHAALRTTLIAGFPGETDEQFEDLCSFVENADFDYIGVFPYSREEGTRAHDLPNQIDEDEKFDRAQRLRDLADAVCAPRVAERIGRELDVLVEGREEDGQLFGRAMCQAPEVDGVTYLKRGDVGEIVRVRIEDTLLYEMEGA